VRQLIAGQRGGFSNMHRLFALVMIELWRRHYGISTVGGEAVQSPVPEPVA
jgi:hypothetical protein